jgi:beta-glucuronidase
MKKIMLAVGIIAAIAVVGISAEKPFTLYDPGTEDIVNYAEYGTFSGIGTDEYKYTITEGAALKKAVGEGVFPNVTGVLQDPEYRKRLKAGKLQGGQWDFVTYVSQDDCINNFYKWCTAPEDPGVKQYYTALALEHAGNLRQAIKAYYAIVIHFPDTVGYTYWKTPWYIGPVAIDRIKYLTHEHPELKMKIMGASIKVLNGFDDNRWNDKYIVNPGKMVHITKASELMEPRVDVSKLKTIKTIGTGSVKLQQYENHHWQLMVDNKPYYVRGMAYSPSKVGLSPDNGTLNPSRDWMWSDVNNNGIIDGPYETFVDKNRTNMRDTYKIVGDFKLMHDMGVNTIRLYHHGGFNNDLLMDGYKTYGFRYLMGDFLGMYAVGSKAEWYSGTDYTNAQQQKNMLDSVRQMVEEYKEAPYILMWVLGNENNYGTPGKAGVTPGEGCRAKLQPEAYYHFVNEAAKLIKSLDPQKRPVAICNGDTLYLDICAKQAPEIDIFGANAYRGKIGFGSLWQDVSDVFDRPAVITEYGCSAYAKGWSQTRAEEGQAEYHRGNWLNIEENFAGSGAGNALGGIVFEWTDEWWKAGPPPEFDPAVHDTTPQSGMPFLDGWGYEEWMGITSQGDGKLSPFLRQLRPAYFMYKKLWSKYAG